MRVAMTFSSVVTSMAVTPVDKVITLLEQLQTQLEAQGKHEAVVYEEFACFCKDTTTSKSNDITAGSSRLEELKGELNQFTTDRKKVTGDVAAAEGSTTVAEKAAEAENVRWQKWLDTHSVDRTDLAEGLRQLEGAISFAKQGRDKKAALLQKARYAVVFADSLGFAAARSAPAVALVQETPGSAGGTQRIISILSELRDDYTEALQAHEKTEVKRRSEHTKRAQASEGTLAALKTTLQDAQERVGALTEDIAEATKEVTTLQAGLVDDQRYLMELTHQCEAKAAAWDARAKLRMEEIATLSEAAAIVKGSVKGAADTTRHHAGAVLLVGDVEDEAEVAAPTEHTTAAASIDELAARSAALVQEAQAQGTWILPKRVEQEPVLVQVSATTHRLRVGVDPARQLLVNLLNDKATILRSELLAEVAVHAAGDPFKKVKNLIQNMIEQMLSEGEASGTKEHWCQEEVDKTTQKRDMKANQVEQVTQTILELEGRATTLREEANQFSQEVGRLNSALTRANTTRTEEHLANARAVDDATDGNTAVQKAIQLLTQFYQKKTKVTAGLIQDVAGEEDGDSTGIIAMLEVIASDFERTIRETTSAEEEAQRAFVSFKAETLVSRKKQNDDLEATTTDLRQTQQELTDRVEDLQEQQTQLNNAIMEWEKLRPACAQEGNASEMDRKSAREDEISSLKTALCMLNDPAGAANCE
mmetsp:Transcript_25731/g.56718  ORF Transcript_25731/g.56718 Transcript_25731/m.56718 type:complete len:705 (-) Transcript_25731:44-2158(-)